MKALLLLVLTISFIQVAADGVQPEGSGSTDDPFRVHNFDNLLWVATNPLYWTGSFIQTGDIVIAPPDSFVSIGNEQFPFQGDYDGQGRLVDGLVISAGNMQGFFGRTSRASIKNLTIANAHISGNDNLGILVGWCVHTNIDSCHVSGTVDGGDNIGGLLGDYSNSSIVSNCSAEVIVRGANSVGGLVGNCYNNAQIIDCVVTAVVTGDWRVGGLVGHNLLDAVVSGCNGSIDVTCGVQYAGGVAGRNYTAVISDCAVSGQVAGDSFTGGVTGCNLGYSPISKCEWSGEVNGGFHTGGIAGSNRSSSEIVNCASRGSVNGIDNVGGVAGDNLGDASISQCCSNCKVFGIDNVGGFIGYQYTIASISDCYSTGCVQGNSGVGGFVGASSGIIDNCYSLGFVHGVTGIGGFAGIGFATNINDCFWNVDTSGVAISHGGTGLSICKMRKLSTYLDAGWDFIDESANGTEDIWGLNPMENGGYPFLAWQGYAHVDNDEHEAPAPPMALLSPAYPNPFNPTTTIRYRLPQAGRATLTVYDIRGRRVATLVNASQPAGEHVVAWDAQGAASGVYLYRLTHNGRTETRSMVLMK